MPLFDKIQNVYRVSKKLRPTIRSIERYKSDRVPTNISGDQENKVGADESKNRVAECDPNSKITSHIKIEELESDIGVDLDLNYSFTQSPIVEMDHCAVKDVKFSVSDANSASTPTFDELQMDAPHLIILAKPHHHGTDPNAHLKYGNRSAPSVTKQNPIPVRYNAQVRGTIDINSNKLTNQQLGDTLRTVVANVVGNALQTLLQNAQSHGMSTNSIPHPEILQQQQKQTVRNTRSMANGNSSRSSNSSSGNDSTSKKITTSKKHGGDVKVEDIESMKREVLGEAAITPPRRSKDSKQKKCSKYARDPELQKMCTKSNVPCKKRDARGAKDDAADRNVSGLTAQSGSVLSIEKPSITENEKVVVVKKAKPLHQQQQIADKDAIPNDKLLEKLSSQSFAMAAAHINPSTAHRSSRRGKSNNEEIPPFYHILPKYKEHFESKQKKLCDGAQAGKDSKLKSVVQYSVMSWEGKEEKPSEKAKVEGSNLGSHLRHFPISTDGQGKKCPEDAAGSKLPKCGSFKFGSFSSYSAISTSGGGKKPSDKPKTDDSKIGSTLFYSAISRDGEETGLHPSKNNDVKIGSVFKYGEISSADEKVKRHSYETKGSKADENYSKKSATRISIDEFKKILDSIRERSKLIATKKSGQKLSVVENLVTQTRNSDKNPLENIQNICDKMNKKTVEAIGNSGEECAKSVPNIYDRWSDSYVKNGRATNDIGGDGAKTGSEKILTAYMVIGSESKGGDNKLGSGKADHTPSSGGTNEPPPCKGTAPTTPRCNNTKPGPASLPSECDSEKNKPSESFSIAADLMDCNALKKKSLESKEESKKDKSSGSGEGSSPPTDCGKYTKPSPSESKDGSFFTIDCSKYRKKENDSDSKLGSTLASDCSNYKKPSLSESKDDSSSVIDCSKYTKTSSNESKEGSSTTIDKTKHASDSKGGSCSIDCSKYKTKEDTNLKESGLSSIDCSKYKTKDDSDSKRGSSAIDCSKYKAKDASDSKEGSSMIDCSKYKTKHDTNSKECGLSSIDCSKYKTKDDSDSKKDSSLIDCSKYKTKNASDSKEVSSAIDCSKYKTKDDSASKGNSSSIDCSKYKTKNASDSNGGSSTIDCSKYKTKEDTNLKECGSSSIDCSKYKTKDDSDSKRGSSAIDCSKYKDASVSKEGSSTIGCSKYKTKHDTNSKECGSSSIDCSKYKTKDDSDSKRGSSAIDCSIYKDASVSKEGSSTIDCSKYKTNEDTNLKEGSLSSIDCSKYKTKDDSDSKKDLSSIDCSKYKAKDASDSKEGSSTIDCSKYKTKEDTNLKECGSSSIDCSKYKTKEDTNLKEGGLSSIDCSKYKTKDDSYSKGGSSAIDCSKYKDASYSKGGSSTIDCSTYKTKDTSDSKADSSSIDCNKYKTTDDSDSKGSGSSSIDCSKFRSKDGSMSGKSDTKGHGPFPMNCSIYTTTFSKPETSKLQTIPVKDKHTRGFRKSNLACPSDGAWGDTIKDTKASASTSSTLLSDYKKYNEKLDPESETKDNSNTGSGTFAINAEQTSSSVKSDIGSTPIPENTFNTDSATFTAMAHDASSSDCGKYTTKPTVADDKLNELSIDRQKFRIEISNGGKSSLSPPSDGWDAVKLEITDQTKAGNVRMESSSGQHQSRPGSNKPKPDFCKSRASKSGTNDRSRYCRPVMCSKDKPELKVDAAKRIKMENADTKPTLFNCCLKISKQKKVEIETCPMPVMCDDYVMFQMHTVGLCGSDVYMFDKGVGKIDNCDISLGHEGSGIVIEVGKNVKHLKEGDAIAIEPRVPCMVCKHCKMGRYNICPNMNFNGLLASYCTHPAQFCHKVPDSMPLEPAALAHPLSLGLHACHRANVSIGSKVLVLGACPLGLASVMSARAMGADKIAVIDTLEKNLKVAYDLCADKTILANDSMSYCELAEKVLSEMKVRPNVVIDCCGCTKTVNMSILAIEQGGVFVLAGCQSECANVPILTALAKEICLRTSFRSANMFPKAITLINSCRADVTKMITHRNEFCESQNAFESALCESKSGAIKVVVNWPQTEAEYQKNRVAKKTYKS